MVLANVTNFLKQLCRRNVFKIGVANAIVAWLLMPVYAAEFSIEAWKARVEAESGINALGYLYLEFMLEEDPSQAVQFGVHGHEGDAWYYDRRMPDASPERAAANSRARAAFVDYLHGIDADALSRDDQVDLHILKTRVEFDQFMVTTMGSQTNPLNAVTTLGTAMSGLVLRDYAPLDDRLHSFAARCTATEDFLAGVRASLIPPNVRPSESNKAVTMQRLVGVTRKGGLYDKTLPELLASSTLSEEEKNTVSTECAAAVDAINKFTSWFEATIMPRENGEWRIGSKRYRQKYALQLDYPLSPEELLAEAKRWMEGKGGELVSVGRKIHDEYLAEEIVAGGVQKANEINDQQVVKDIFTKMSEDRSTIDTLIDDSYAMADDIIGFVREKNLMDLPPASKLRIEDIPPHLAGNAVARIVTAPPFEPHLESVWFWDLQLLAGSEDFLKEYNRPTLAMVYIHEGVPGHFVQLDYSNRFKRIMPKVFWNGAMVEGWASYIATQLVDQGFTIYPDKPVGHELQQMVDDKLVLRGIINTIIDIRLQTTDWSEEEAVTLMMNKGFQEEGEARGKLVRAKLSSVQLTSYLAGQMAIEKILAEYRQIKGNDFTWKDFNERLVSAGSPPFFALREYMLSKK
jgi:uncharacterized protein (DUF885 family)